MFDLAWDAELAARYSLWYEIEKDINSKNETPYCIFKLKQFLRVL